MIQHENNLKSLGSENPTVTAVTSIQQGLTQSVFTVAANNNRVKFSVQNLGLNPLNVLIANQLIAVVGLDSCFDTSGSEARLAIGLSSELGTDALIVSYVT